MQTSFADRPGRLTLRELTRARAAARRAQLLHPGPVGELLARELRAHAEFGYRFGADTLLVRLTADLLDGAPPPEDPLARLLGRVERPCTQPAGRRATPSARPVAAAEPAR